MNELIENKDSMLQEYEKLLMEKELLSKEAYRYQVLYMKVFGDLLTECFNLKISIIEKKKIIRYCQRIINKGGRPVQSEIDNYIKETMEEYYNELKDMVNRFNSSKNGTRVSEYTVRKIKSIYHGIAKLIHPDMNPSLAGNEKINELWNRVVITYKCNQLKEIEELEVLINQYLESINYKRNELIIPDIEEKIKKLKEEIEVILDTDPYQYKYLLEDDEEIESTREEMIIENKEYVRYGKELDELIKNFNIERMLA